MKRSLNLFLLVILCITAYIASHTDPAPFTEKIPSYNNQEQEKRSQRREKTYQSTRQPALLMHLIDGDTLTARHNGTMEKIRLLGIDTPEMHSNPKAERDAQRDNLSLKEELLLGQAAYRFVSTLVNENESITLEFDEERRDDYDRLLAYVYLKDGTMLNEVIIKNGFARPMPHKPNTRYKDRFDSAYQNARFKHLGLWNH